MNVQQIIQHQFELCSMKFKLKIILFENIINFASGSLFLEEKISHFLMKIHYVLTFLLLTFVLNFESYLTLACFFSYDNYIERFLLAY